MLSFLDGLREVNTASLLLRLVMAVLFGGVIGLERGRKRRAAGFRTYMLVCIGAALTMILGQYLAQMLTLRWGSTAASIDVARFGAQVINGVGFLGAGTVIVTGHQEVKGLTTAACLWASACAGLAIGAGFYELVLLVFVLIFLCIRLLPLVETHMVEHSRNINLYIEFSQLDYIDQIIACIKSQNVQIYDVEIDWGSKNGGPNPSAVFTMRMRESRSHSALISAISRLDCIRKIDEV